MFVRARSEERDGDGASGDGHVQSVDSPHGAERRGLL